MSGLLERLLNIARSHIQDFMIDPLWPEPTIPPYEDIDDSGPEEPYRHRRHTDNASGTGSSRASGTGSQAHRGLPHSAELAHCYTLLDLPFGAPMEEVNQRWKTYLKRCHPDLFARDAAKQAEATELTQALIGAHSKIEAAWKRYQP